MTLPNTFIVAAPKAGSTWLADRLRDHPQVFLPPEKELHFFTDDRNWARGIDWYREFFGEHAGEPVTIDATPTAAMFPEAMRRMREHVPDAKLLAIFRDPPGRAHSNWRHVYYRNVTELRPFAQMVDDELREGVRMPRRDRCDYGDLRHLSHGLYLEQLRIVLEYFPREQLHVVLLDDVRQDAVGVLTGVCRFLGIDDPDPALVRDAPANPHKEFRPLWLWRLIVRRQILRPLPGRARHRISRWMSTESRTPEPMDAETRARLEAFYETPNADLAEYLGKDLRWTR